MNKIKTYRDLLIWKKSMNLVTEIYQITKNFPQNEIYSLVSQIRRSAISIPSNIAEGYGRKSTKDYLRFLQIAVGSIYELQTQIEISLNLHYINDNGFNELFANIKEIERMISSLIIKINK